MTASKWTQKDKINFIKMRKEGVVFREIAQKLGKTYDSLRERSERSNRNHKGMTEIEAKVIAPIIAAAKNDDTCPTNYVIAAQVGLPVPVVNGAVRSLSKKGVMEIALNGSKRRVAYIFVGAMTTRDMPCLEAGFTKAQNFVEFEEHVKVASMALLRRQLETGAHWIRCPKQFQAACESVGLEVAA